MLFIISDAVLERFWVPLAPDELIFKLKRVVAIFWHRRVDLRWIMLEELRFFFWVLQEFFLKKYDMHIHIENTLMITELSTSLVKYENKVFLGPSTWKTIKAFPFLLWNCENETVINILPVSIYLKRKVIEMTKI